VIFNLLFSVSPIPTFLSIHSPLPPISPSTHFPSEELPHGSLLRGWDNFASANLQAPNSRHKPLPEASRFFSGCVKNQGQPIEVSQTEIFKDTPTIILSKGTQQNNPGGYGGTGPVKRPAP